MSTETTSTIDLQIPVRQWHRRAKIVCTLGPSSHSEEMIRELMRAGMDVARLNFSHGTHEDHSAVIRRLRKVAEQEGRSICILQDLQGPKMRTGRLKDGKPVLLKSGAKVTLTTRDVPGTAAVLSTSFQALPQAVEPGATILLSDGRLSLRVKKIAGTDIECEVIDGGLLAEKQGINLPGAVLSVPSLTEKDYKDLAFGVKHGVDIVAVSFVRTADDVRAAKRFIAEHDASTPVIAKLEKPQAIDNLEDIFAEADGVMVARGDLGVELPPERVPIIQKHVIHRAQDLRKPVITATQMLESMIHNPRPTRAEASDVANAILDGSDAVMLSAESAAGDFPREAVNMMARIIVETEEHLRSTFSRRRREPRELSISETICESVAHAAEDLNMKAIAVYTESGTTARLVSKYRPRAEVYAFAPDTAVCNRANLFWGVHPICCSRPTEAKSMLEHAQAELLRRGAVTPNDVMAIVAGTQKRTGSTNFLQLHVVQGAKLPGRGSRPRTKK